MNQLALLDAWERARPLGPDERAVALLAAADPAAGDPAALPLGVRDGRLLDLHAALFGPRLEATATCPACGEPLELTLAVDQLRATPAPPTEVPQWRGYEVSVRPPDSRDLAAVSGLPPAAAEAELRRRCVSVVDGTVDDLDPAAVDEAILAADPQAELVAALTCQPCGHRWRAPLDVPAFVWARLESAAYRCAVEVHALASAYGWREADILAMSPWRRALYLAMVPS
jgi:hypothetical protein